MTIGISVQNQDLDNLFDLWVTGAKAANTGINYGNPATDIAQRYQALAAGGSQRPDVGLSGNTGEIARIFAQKGSTAAPTPSPAPTPPPPTPPPLSATITHTSGSFVCTYLPPASACNATAVLQATTTGGTGAGLTYSWTSTGATCTFGSPTAASTTVTQVGGASLDGSTTTVTCSISDSGGNHTTASFGIGWGHTNTQ